eukprot:15448404-Alexandrium_andersonii.AAC.1
MLRTPGRRSPILAAWPPGTCVAQDWTASPRTQRSGRPFRAAPAPIGPPTLPRCPMTPLR